MRSAVACFGAFIGLATVSSALADTDRVVVPIEQVKSPLGPTLYAVQIGVAGKPLQLVLDTGSDGVQVLASALPEADTPSKRSETESFGNGVSLHSTLRVADVAFGTISQNVEIGVIRTARCDNATPACAVAKSPLSKIWAGMQGLAGIQMQPEHVSSTFPNPLQGVAGAWIVELPAPGSKSPGSLILNPRKEDLKGFVLYPAWTGNMANGGTPEFPGCIWNDKSKTANFCGPVAFDTGAIAVGVTSVRFKTKEISPPGGNVHLAFGNDTSPKVAAQYVVQPSFFPTRTFWGPPVHPGDDVATRILAGIEPYLLFDVLYDRTNGQIGLRPR